jgi:hypothetical protein
MGARMSLGCPTSADTPRSPSFVVRSSDEQQHVVGRGHKEAVDVKRRLDYSIGCDDPLVYIEMGGCKVQMARGG